jgi:LCP family protein required for cell wall assembly
MTDHENLIRQAVAAQANEAVDPAVVLAGLGQGNRSRRRSFTLVAAAGLAVAAGVVAVVAVVVPLTAAHQAPAPPAAVAAAPATEQNVLLVGLDGNAFTDSIVLARIGADGALRAVSLPRDSGVDVPGQGKSKLNWVYAQARQAALDQGRDPAAADADGMKALVTTVQALTGVHADHYASVDLAGFDSLSSAVGGVEVCLKTASHDRYSGADFPAGRQTLSGEPALAFLRQRAGLPDSDLSRVTRQQAFLRALVAKVVGGDTLRDPKSLATLLTAVRTNVHVDQGWDLEGLARQMTRNSAVAVATIPVGQETSAQGGGFVLDVDPAAVRSFVTGFLSGTGTPGSGAGPAGPQAGDVPCVN